MKLSELKKMAAANGISLKHLNGKMLKKSELAEKLMNKGIMVKSPKKSRKSRKASRKKSRKKKSRKPKKKSRKPKKKSRKPKKKSRKPKKKSRKSKFLKKWAPNFIKTPLLRKKNN